MATKRSPDISADRSRAVFALFALALLVGSAILSSFINFPPGDSWTHGWVVREWIRGNFVFNNWSSTIALPQQILGWIVHLRAETVHWQRLSILTAIITVAGCLFAARLPGRLYPQWARLKDWSPFLAFVCLAPTFTLKTAAGFMTDGYYLFFLASSMWMLLLALDKPEDQSDALWGRRWLGFSALATLAALQRTHGLTILLVVGLWVLFAKVLFPSGRGESGSAGNKGWPGLRGWVPVILCAIGALFALLVLADPSLSTMRSAEVAQEMKDFWLGRVMSYPGLLRDRMWLAFGILQHFGLAMLPLALIAGFQHASEERKGGSRAINWWFIVVGVAFVLLTLTRWMYGYQWRLEALFPYVGNSLTPEGFGPRSDTLALTAGHILAPWVRIVLTILGTLGGVVLIWLCSRTVRLRRIDWRAPSTLIGLIGLAHIGLIFLNYNFFDRYLLPLIPFAFCWIAPLIKDAPSQWRRAGAALVLLMLAWSLWGTADSLSWTRAKWDLAAEARVNGIPCDQIVAGYEPDGYFNFRNENYPDPNVQKDMTSVVYVWWVDKLGLSISPEWVIIEEGAHVQGTQWEDYFPTVMRNDRMRIWVK